MYYITDKDELKALRRLASGKLKLPELGYGLYVEVADAARAECRWCRTKIRKGEKAIKVQYTDGNYIVSYQVHFTDKECVIDPRISRKLVNK